MGMKRESVMSHAMATADPRPIRDFLPKDAPLDEHFRLAAFHAREVGRASGQTKFHHRKQCLAHLKEGLKW